MKKTRSKEGFTIIEVVLVLAIAGLIMLMVFVALPALQRSQRDTQRREDMSRLVTAMNNYSSLHAGVAPTIAPSNADAPGDFITGYLTANNDTFNDPSGTSYFFKEVRKCESSGCTNAPTSFEAGAIYAYSHASCSNSEDGTPTYKNGSKSYAFIIKLEGPGAVCVNN